MYEQFTNTNRECGAALIVGLVLMMVLTLLAISTMRTSTLELAMAGNAQYHEQATQLAETGVDDAINRIDNVEIVPNPVTDWIMNFSRTVPQGGYDVSIRYLECGDPPANVSGTFKADYYEIESVGRSAARNARSTLRHGFWTIATTCTT